jgi:hypothetical protein
MASQQQSPTCQDIGAGVTVFGPCPGRFFAHFIGSFAWYPLRYVGPIEVEVETGSSVYTQFPLYVQIVPLDGVDPTEVCQNAPGYVLMTLFPRRSTRSDPCDFWERSGVVDLSSILPVGSTYVLRFYNFLHPFGNSPGVDCVRVTAHAAQPASVAAMQWGRAKCLYR